MSKKRFTKLIIILILLILVVCITQCFRGRYGEKNVEIISFDSSSINKMCQFEGNYYYTLNNEIYCNEKCILSSDGKKLIYANNNAIFVYADGVISEYDANFSIISEYTLSYEITIFAVSDNELIYLSPDMSCHVLELSTGDEKEPINKLSLSDEIEVLSYQEYKVCRSNNDSIAIFLNNKLIYSQVKNYAKNFVYLDNDKIIYTSKTNTSTINLYSYVLTNNALSKYLDLPADFGIITFLNSNDSLIFIGTEYPTDPSLGLQDGNKLVNHKSDCIVFMEKNDLNSKVEHFTKKSEKTIYADSEKAITYYKGKYLTYSLDGWKVTNKQSASEIKEGGSYNFVTCGDYIFVFDNNSGELLNRIHI